MLLLGTPICLRGPPSWSADAISLSLLEKISPEPVRVRTSVPFLTPRYLREEEAKSLSLILTFKVSFFRHHQHLPPLQLREIDNHGGNGDVGR